ncbi:MAG: cupredoxin domain-containing protein [bacterium]|nr:cupredoxin domain-containing protein [bacterium]
MTRQQFFTTSGMIAIALVIGASALGIGQRIAASASAATSVVAAPRGDGSVQRVALGYDGRNYTPETIRVRRGVPVEITADLATLRGCFTSFVIPDLNLWTQFTTARPTFAFTPDRAGTFRFTCAMGMGSGRLIVEG